MRGGPWILIIGGDHGSMRTARRLESPPRPGEASTMVARPAAVHGLEATGRRGGAGQPAGGEEPAW